MTEPASAAVQPGGATVHKPPRRQGANCRPRPWRWAVPRDDLKRLLGKGLSASEIARHHGVARTTVSRAIRALEHQDLVSIAASAQTGKQARRPIATCVTAPAPHPRC